MKSIVFLFTYVLLYLSKDAIVFKTAKTRALIRCW